MVRFVLFEAFLAAAEADVGDFAGGAIGEDGRVGLVVQVGRAILERADGALGVPGVFVAPVDGAVEVDDL